MKKPTIFISSTIYDFQDLRSALKYWLDENGFETQLSEYNDFQKDVTLNSYDACLQSIENCDYFVLLIGSRRGGLYPGENKSITQKEYEKAYELAKQGRIKKIIIFIRQSVWDIKEDRKALAKTISSINQKGDKDHISDSIVNHNSSILQDAESIISFINTVTRNKEAKNAEKPIMNWIHVFRSFSEIIEALKVELRINQDISTIIAEQNVKTEVLYNLQLLLAKEQNTVYAFYRGFSEIHNILVDNRKEYVECSFVDTAFRIPLTSHQIDMMSNFALFCRTGIDDIDSFILEQTLSSGAFLEYSKSNDRFEQSQFSRAVHQLIFEIRKLKQANQSLTSEIHAELLAQIKKYNEKRLDSYTFSFISLALLNNIYIRISNIVDLSEYLIKCIDTHDLSLTYPKLLSILANEEKPTEEELEHGLLSMNNK